LRSRRRSSARVKPYSGRTLDFEQGGAQHVVEILGKQFLLRLGEPPHLGGKFRDRLGAMAGSACSAPFRSFELLSGSRSGNLRHVWIVRLNQLRNERRSMQAAVRAEPPFIRVLVIEEIAEYPR